MTYPNKTSLPNYDTADEASSFLRTDVAAASPSSLSFGLDETAKPQQQQQQKKKQWIVGVAGGVAGCLLLAVTGGYYRVETTVAAPASASGSSSRIPNKFDKCLTPVDSFRGVSVNGFKRDAAFQTCYADGGPTGTVRCWSNSFYYEAFWELDYNGWCNCIPKNGSWAVVAPYPDGSCGPPCTTFSCKGDAPPANCGDDDDD